ncbi:hypothetical protein [Rhodococcus spongiicola]|uniref:PE-PPE domain-containing protein n=1 Tax=Rhodococcus spongiicola TaxID=2487352 RepID=A0A3S3AK15_9NOCA|nr:hypothetical protein [Rhodococcus spongiicola]RVW06524.1 hypothetical protein EF834_03705 [Rhodococcus spongiicola]
MTAPTDPTMPTEPASHDIHLLWIPGTGESYVGDTRTWDQVKAETDSQGNLGISMGHKLMEQVFDRIPVVYADEPISDHLGNVIPHWIGYSVSVSSISKFENVFGLPSTDSRLVAKSALLEKLKSLPDGAKAIVGGYSQGAAAAFEFCNEVAMGMHTEVSDKVGAGLYIANPLRPNAHGSNGLNEVGIELDGWGIADDDGANGPATRQMWQMEFINDRDVICNADPDSYLRGLADLPEFFELGGDLAHWSSQLEQAIERLDWSTKINSWRDFPALVSGISRANGEFAGYKGGEHTRAYWDREVRTLKNPVDGTEKTILEAEIPWVASICYYILHPGA